MASCSEKLDVEDHYVAWRQTHDSPNHGMTVDGPFSFCSFPFLLHPRAKSKLLHTEARCLMTQASASHLTGLSTCMSCLQAACAPHTRLCEAWGSDAAPTSVEARQGCHNP